MPPIVTVGKRTPVLMLNAYNKNMVDEVAQDMAIVITDRNIAEKVAARERESILNSKRHSSLEENKSAVNQKMIEAVVT